jgi:UDP-3-O-[3-hydroxymyristoyl] glucosamine N-acyltransferase
MLVFTLAEIAKQIGGKLNGDPKLEIHGVAEIDKAREGELTFLANPKYKEYLDRTRATAVVIDSKTDVDPTIPCIKVPDAYFGFLQAFLMFNKPKKLLQPGIHPSAVVHETAKIGKETAIGAHVYIGANVEMGERCQIFPNCVILDDTVVGDDCILYPAAGIRENTRIGNRVIIHNGAIIGSDGFGFAPFEGKFHKIPQVGRVVIENDVEIGANATIDRATLGETVVKQGAKIDNLVHLAHNVTVGEHTVIAAQTGISGSTRIGRYAMIGGQVGTVGHITIGDRVQIGAQSGVSKSVPEGEIVFGYPARPIMKTKRIEAALNNLPELLKRVKKLEDALEKSGNND